MMYLGDQAVGINNPPPNIRHSIITMTESSTTITFPVLSKPWGFLISCDNDDAYNGSQTKRVSGMWSEYNGGVYIGLRYAVVRNANYDHYALANDNVQYDDINKTFSITVVGHPFTANTTYYLWYYTLPFNTNNGGDT